MRNPLLDRSSPTDLAEREQVVDQEEQIEAFPQLAQVLEDDLALLEGHEVPPKWREWPVAIRLRFGWAGGDRVAAAVEGRVLARVPAACQRCLGPMEVSLDVALRLQFAVSGESVPAAEGYETWELDEASLRPLDVVEEALIMAMPLVALHAPGADCTVTAESGDAANEDRTRPFAGLRARIEAQDRRRKED